MRSDSRRRIVAKLVAEAEAEISGETLPAPECEESVTPSEITPEFILETAFVGPATVRFLVGDVRSLDLEHSNHSGPTQTLVIFPASARRAVDGSSSSKVSGVQQFCVILSPDIVLRLVNLGIEEVAGHLGGRQLHVSGTVERQEQEPPLTGLIYRIWVNSLDQLIWIGKSSAVG